MLVIYMGTDTPFGERVQGLYPLIESTLIGWAAGKVPYAEFSDFMDYIRDEVETLDIDDNFCIGIWEWEWGAGKLFLPEDVPIFLEMLHPNNLHSQAVQDQWNAYWKAVDIKERALSYLKQHPNITDQELKDLLMSVPPGDALAFGLYKNDEAFFLKKQMENNEKYFQKIETLFQQIRTIHPNKE